VLHTGTAFGLTVNQKKIRTVQQPEGRYRDRYDIRAPPTAEGVNRG